MTIAAARIVSPAARLVGVLALLSSFGLAGCGSISDQTAASALVAPGKFDVYSCRDIEQRQRQASARFTELEQLMARAAQSPGGEFVGALAYRSEYLQTQGELEQLAKSASEKQCPSQSKWSSGRALF